MQVPEWIKKNPDVLPGWHAILEDAHEKMVYLDPKYEIAQIKEKFGVLRFYWQCNSFGMKQTGWRIIQDIVSIAEQRTATRCEVCAKHGELRNQGAEAPKYWMKTLCKAHAKEQGYKLEDHEE